MFRPVLATGQRHDNGAQGNSGKIEAMRLLTIRITHTIISLLSCIQLILHNL